MTINDMLNVAKGELRVLRATHPGTSRGYALLLDAAGNPVSEGGLSLLRQTMTELRPFRNSANAIGRVYGLLADCEGMISSELAKPTEVMAVEEGTPEEGVVDWESQLTGIPPIDEWIYQKAEYTATERMAFKLGLPLDITKEELAEYLADEAAEFEEVDYGDDFDEEEIDGDVELGDFDDEEEEEEAE
jgi:hypothetical protein